MNISVMMLQLPLPMEGDCSLSTQPWYFGSFDRAASEQKLARFRATVIGCLHDPANVKQTSSISTCILLVFAGRLLDRVNTP